MVELLVNWLVTKIGFLASDRMPIGVKINSAQFNSFGDR
jgi:hypothetical protein